MAKSDKQVRSKVERAQGAAADLDRSLLTSKLARPTHAEADKLVQKAVAVLNEVKQLRGML